MAEPTYFTSIVASVAGANKHHLSLWNGVGSGKVIRIYKIIASGAPTAAVTGQVIPLFAARITTQPAAGGTVPTIRLADTADPAVPAQITARAGTTTTLTVEAEPFGAGTVSGEETSSAIRTTIYEFSIDGLKPIRINEGMGITVRQGALASAGAINIVIVFTITTT